MRMIFFCFMLALMTIACKSKQGANGNDTACKTIATVKDFTGLDGCRFLFILENGDKLLAAEMPTFDLKDAQQVKINYKIIKDAVSMCMAENAIVEITCISGL